MFLPANIADQIRSPFHGLYLTDYRVYAPRLGRFTQKDPIGISVFISHPIPAAVEYQACMK